MAEKKKILVSLPCSLLAEIDSIISFDNSNRSEFVRQATKFYIREKKKLNMKENMKRGYKEMSTINIGIAENYFSAENEIHSKYEQLLLECE